MFDSNYRPKTMNWEIGAEGKLASPCKETASVRSLQSLTEAGPASSDRGGRDASIRRSQYSYSIKSTQIVPILIILVFPNQYPNFYIRDLVIL